TEVGFQPCRSRKVLPNHIDIAPDIPKKITLYLKRFVEHTDLDSEVVFFGYFPRDIGICIPVDVIAAVGIHEVRAPPIPVYCRIGTSTESDVRQVKKAPVTISNRIITHKTPGCSEF